MRKYLIAALIGTFFIYSCVPKRDLVSSQKHIKNLQSDSSSTHYNLNICRTNNDSLRGQLGTSNSKVDSLRNLSYYSDKTIGQQAQELRFLQGIIQRQKDAMNNLKKTMADALVNFKPDELTVTLKNGKLYVSMEEKLLFPSGSAVVNPKGKEALMTLASVLNKTPNITIDVEGHTDTVPIRGKYEDNWALSTARATAVSRILINDYGVNPHLIIASGRSKYDPVADNTTDEGRARNRRTEIILSPDLSELFRLLNE
jgi:chemotaxis protein MotB